MKLTVNKYLNARIGEPSTYAPCQFYKEPGSTVEIDDVLVGTEIEGNSIWYHCHDDGCYYWSGGISNESWGLQIFDSSLALGSRPLDFQFLIFKSLIPEFIKKYDQSFITAVVPKLEQNEVVLNIFTDNLNHLNIPNTIVFNGFLIKVSIELTNPVKPDTSFFSDTTRPFVMGGSLAFESSDLTEIGTRGLKLYLNNLPVLLTCYHVACCKLMSQNRSFFNGDHLNMIVPYSKSGSTVEAISGNVNNGRLMDFYDYSLIAISDDNTTENIAGIGLPNGYYSALDIDTVVHGTLLRTFGCVSGSNGMVKSGRVTKPSISSSYISIDYAFLSALKIYGTIEAEKISTSGDSGAPVVDSKNKIVGIIIASSQTNSYIMPFYKLLNIHSLKLTRQ